MMHDLYNAPPRLSDLRGDELREALFRRSEEARHNWLQTRQQRSPLRRAAEWVRDRIEGARA